MKRAITISDRILVPVPPSQADIWSAQRFIHFVESLVSGKSRPEIIGFINRADTNQAIRETSEAAAALVSLPGIRYLKPRIATRTVYRRSFSEGLAVFELEPRGKGAKEWNALVAALYPRCSEALQRPCWHGWAGVERGQVRLTPRLQCLVSRWACVIV